MLAINLIFGYFFLLLIHLLEVRLILFIHCFAFIIFSRHIILITLLLIFCILSQNTFLNYVLQILNNTNLFIIIFLKLILFLFFCFFCIFILFIIKEINSLSYLIRFSLIPWLSKTFGIMYFDAISTFSSSI
jgi:hypothetical protein